jgi:pimeloyl-ACP methyl ester carboxylesterase
MGSGLDHVRLGTGASLLLLHPLGGDREVWRPVLDRLAKERDVVAVDMPGFGGSPALSAGLVPAPEALAASVAEFCRAEGIERPHAAGISLGGWVALELAKRGEARSVTALCPAGFWHAPLGPRRETARNTARALLPVMRPLLRSARGRRLVLAGAVAHPDRVPPDAAYGMVRAYARAPGFADASLAMRNGVFSGIERIDVPVTLAWAEHDRLVRRPARDPEGVRSIVLRDCGHVPTFDDPEQVARVLLEASG